MGTLYLTHPFSAQIPDPGVKMTSCGLLTGSKKPVPLHSGSVTVLIRGFMADVGCELLYRNEEPGPVEAVFVFPVDAEVAIYAFQGAPASRPSSERRNRQSVAYTQQTMAESLQRVQQLQADLGGTEILAPLQAIYRSPCRDGHPRQLFVFTDGEVGNTQDVIAEVQRHRGAHRCFSFGIGEGASTALVKGIARSLKWALQPAVTGISLSWDLPPGMEAALLGRGPEVIFPGQRCLIYAQLRGQPQYRIQDQTYKETLQFPLQPQDGDRLPVHRLAAKSLLLELEGPVDTGSEGDRRRALETSLSSGVVCSLTAYVGVDTERGQPVQGPLVRRDIPLAGFKAVASMQHVQCLSLVSCGSRRPMARCAPRVFGCPMQAPPLAARDHTKDQLAMKLFQVEHMGLAPMSAPPKCSPSPEPSASRPTPRAAKGAHSERATAESPGDTPRRMPRPAR
ncbi:hypothetical protein KIL84_009962 [Mauremys mutica]|uniref:VWFA domain-containing protein n=1 Tax=Mauremys mutica TaxID=74926 RepID=A0A9D3XLP7_9SAUR|nr:hypothetical protein KIL84_009962 [Mauremys mutica]